MVLGIGGRKESRREKSSVRITQSNGETKTAVSIFSIFTLLFFLTPNLSHSINSTLFSNYALMLQGYGRKSHGSQAEGS